MLYNLKHENVLPIQYEAYIMPYQHYLIFKKALQQLEIIMWLCQYSLGTDFTAITIFLTRLMTHRN